MSIDSQYIKLALVILGIFFIVTLSRDVQELISSRDRIINEREQVKKLEEEQQELAQELEYSMSEEFVEKIARDELLMGKPGETVVLLPGEGGIEKKIEFEDEDEELENWEKWMKLFL